MLSYFLEKQTKKLNYGKPGLSDTTLTKIVQDKPNLAFFVLP